eukprot:CAMPEP_0196148876 /NCGR_PEP_ID=MMETSP0910-20130528/28614_1 /TAXON_ID=49265 /ORGANISM="Thalassiosira rotula, Strain GSO102" /LENGTH=69 /DNA_ID=CAMNT_0041411673 /DNA_START=12 /DNA_END=218 /DNA_ORIENTATION=+
MQQLSNSNDNISDPDLFDRPSFNELQLEGLQWLGESLGELQLEGLEDSFSDMQVPSSNFSQSQVQAKLF